MWHITIWYILRDHDIICSTCDKNPFERSKCSCSHRCFSWIPHPPMTSVEVPSHGFQQLRFRWAIRSRFQFGVEGHDGPQGAWSSERNDQTKMSWRYNLETKNHGTDIFMTFSVKKKGSENMDPFVVSFFFGPSLAAHMSASWRVRSSWYKDPGLPQAVAWLNWLPSSTLEPWRLCTKINVWETIDLKKHCELNMDDRIHLYISLFIIFYNHLSWSSMVMIKSYQISSSNHLASLWFHTSSCHLPCLRSHSLARHVEPLNLRCFPEHSPFGRWTSFRFSISHGIFEYRGQATHCTFESRKWPDTTGGHVRSPQVSRNYLIHLQENWSSVWFSSRKSPARLTKAKAHVTSTPTGHGAGGIHKILEVSATGMLTERSNLGCGSFGAVQLVEKTSNVGGMAQKNSKTTMMMTILTLGSRMCNGLWHTKFGMACGFQVPPFPRVYCLIARVVPIQCSPGFTKATSKAAMSTCHFVSNAFNIGLVLIICPFFDTTSVFLFKYSWCFCLLPYSGVFTCVFAIFHNIERPPDDLTIDLALFLNK